MECKCRVCGNIWQAKPANLESGFGCPNCKTITAKEKQLKTQYEFEQELLSIHNDVLLIGKYTGNKNNVELQCLKCGKHWSAMPINLLRKDKKATGCPHCKRSHGEQYISEWLDAHGIKYENQKMFDGLLGVGGNKLSYDFFLPDNGILLEYQGEYHDHTARIQDDIGYLIQSEHDMRKKKYAEDNGYTYFPIWYYDNKEQKLKLLISKNTTDPVTTTAT